MSTTKSFKTLSVRVFCWNVFFSENSFCLLFHYVSFLQDISNNPVRSSPSISLEKQKRSEANTVVVNNFRRISKSPGGFQKALECFTVVYSCYMCLQIFTVVFTVFHIFLYFLQFFTVFFQSVLLCLHFLLQFFTFLLQFFTFVYSCLLIECSVS